MRRAPNAGASEARRAHAARERRLLGSLADDALVASIGDVEIHRQVIARDNAAKAWEAGRDGRRERATQRQRGQAAGD